jgi:hypothetical protein
VSVIAVRTLNAPIVADARRLRGCCGFARLALWEVHVALRANETASRFTEETAASLSIHGWKAQTDFPQQQVPST